MPYLKIFILFLCSSFYLWLDLSNAQAAAVIFNEIHYDSVPKTDLAEFVELYNPGAEPIDISGWVIEGGIDYLIPSDTTLAPESYLIIAQEPDKVRQKYALSADILILGSYEGRLSTQGEQLTLRNHKGDEINQLDYTMGFPWPTVNVGAGDDPNREQTIGLIHPQLDNSHPGSWRSGQPTPGHKNIVHDDNPPPLVNKVEHMPQAPKTGDDVTITVHVTPSLASSPAITKVILHYMIVAPGSYIPRADLYSSQWPTQAMYDDGNGGDKEAGDGIYTTILASEHQLHRRLIRYRIQAIDSVDTSTAIPYEDDPQPNFAYFVYDDLPAWDGSINPTGDGDVRERARYDFAEMEPVPVYHFIARRMDIDQALFAPPRGDGYMGKEYRWHGTLVYEDTKRPLSIGGNRVYSSLSPTDSFSWLAWRHPIPIMSI